jgi:hypothetical protein
MTQKEQNFIPKPPSPEQDKPIKSEKEIAWKEKLLEVNKIIDGLGLEIDEKIKDTVVAFLLHKFNTNASCEGHVAEEGEEEHGLPYPWVDIFSPKPEG